MYQSQVPSATAGTARTAVALVAIFSLLVSLFAIVQPVAADHSGGFDHQPLPIDTSDFGADGDECDEFDLAPGEVVLHWIANQQNVTEPITLTLTLEGGGTISEDSTKWNEPGQINSNVTHHFYFALDADVVVTDLDLSTNEGNVRLSHVCRGEQNGGEVDEDLVLIKQDTEGGSLSGVGFTLGDGAEVLTVDGQITFENLTAGEFTLTETSNPDEDCETGGTLTVNVSAEGDITVTDDDENDGLAIVSFDAETNTLTLSNDCEEVVVEEGVLEIIKFFCPTAGDDSILVIGPAPEEPIEGFGIQSEHDDDPTPPEPGCTLGEAADGTTAEFSITGGPAGFVPITVETEKNQIIELDLEPGDYTITETSTGLTANFTILAENDTAVLVINRPEVLEEDQGNIKVIKLFCEGAEDDVVFTIVEGSDESLGDALVETPDEAFNCEVGDAAFTLNDGETDSATFTVGPDGIRLIPVDVGTYSLTEVLPNQATSNEFGVAEGETTTVIVFNLEGEEGEEEETVEVSIMKHLCTDVATLAEFEAIEAEAAEENPDNAFAPLVATVLACPTIVFTGDIPTEGAVSGGDVDFEFSVLDANGTQMLSEDGTFMQGALCETDVNLDADGDGEITDDVCLDVSHYSFEVVDGVVIITETDAPAGHRLGTIRFTPGSDDDAAYTNSGVIETAETTGVIVIDTTLDEDDAVMVHAYNFVLEGTEGGGTSPDTTDREGTAGGNPLPDTATSPIPGGSVPAALLALALLSGLGAAGYAMATEARRRR